MPYIKPEDRERIEQNICAVRTPGELNYVITRLCLMYVEANNDSYNTYNSLIGVLECAKLEFYRRAVAKYEDEKIQTNGDVY